MLTQIYRHYAIYRCVFCFFKLFKDGHGWGLNGNRRRVKRQPNRHHSNMVGSYETPDHRRIGISLCSSANRFEQRKNKILYRAYFSELVASKILTVLDSLNQKRLRKQTFGCRIRFVSKRWLFFYWYQSIFEANWNWNENTSKYKFALILFYGISSTSF